jgi:hypothetical protein
MPIGLRQRQTLRLPKHASESSQKLFPVNTSSLTRRPVKNSQLVPFQTSSRHDRSVVLRDLRPDAAEWKIAPNLVSEPYSLAHFGITNVFVSRGLRITCE